MAWPWDKIEAAAKAEASKALAAIPARLPRWAAVAIVVLLVAVLVSAWGYLRSRQEIRKTMAWANSQTQAIADAAKAGDERHAGEMAVKDARVAVAIAREKSALGKLEAYRRERATTWTRPTSADALADRFEALGYPGVVR